MTTHETPAAGSLLGAVADAWNVAYEQGERLLIWVPCWHGKLFARFEVLRDEDEIERISPLIQSDDDLEFICAYLSAACTGVFVLDEMGRPQEATDQAGEPIVGLGAQLANALAGKVPGMDLARGERDTLMCLTRQNPGALRTWYRRIERWEVDTSREVEGQLMGESFAGVRSTRSPAPAA